jgi:hypothetical protein
MAHLFATYQLHNTFKPKNFLGYVKQLSETSCTIRQYTVFPVEHLFETNTH